MVTIAYEFVNIEPIKIANIDSSQKGQSDTLRYIPGSSLRGVFLNRFARRDDFYLEKKNLLSNRVRFLNAYSMVGEQKLYPSIKGFYEHKVPKEDEKGKCVVSVLDTGDLPSNVKRAYLGDCCYIKDGVVLYSKVEVSDSLNIQVQKNKQEKKVFRSQMIKAGQKFHAEIVLEEGSEKYEDEILRILNEERIRIGSDLTSGYGLCEITNIEVRHKSFESKDLILNNHNIYLVLQSNTVMRDENGEYCGIYLPYLEEQLGVPLKITLCSTSTTKVSAINRTWGMRTPEITMYEAGSVFKLEYKGSIEVHRLQALEDSGIGVLRNIGCGRIAFMNDIDKIKRKKEIAVTPVARKNATLSKEEEQAVLIAKKGLLTKYIEECIMQYILNKPLNNMNNSQYGIVMSMCENLRYRDTNSILTEFNEYLTHMGEKEKAQKKQSTKAGSRRPMIQMINEVINTPIYETLELKKLSNYEKYNNVLSEEEDVRYRLELLRRQIQFKLRGALND